MTGMCGDVFLQSSVSAREPLERHEAREHAATRFIVLLGRRVQRGVPALQVDVTIAFAFPCMFRKTPYLLIDNFVSMMVTGLEKRTLSVSDVRF